MNYEKDMKTKPNFGAQYGFVYPFVWRILDVLSSLSLYSHLPTTTAIRADVYVCVWFVIDMLCLFVLSQTITYWAAVLLSI